MPFPAHILLLIVFRSIKHGPPLLLGIQPIEAGLYFQVEIIKYIVKKRRDRARNKRREKMRKKRICAIAMGLVMAASLPTAHAENDAYLKVTAENQGVIKGSVTKPGRENYIKVVAVTHGIESKRDVSGFPTDSPSIGEEKQGSRFGK